MTKTKRPFIDKKNSQTFRVVHRSQRDPLINYEDAPRGVLLSTHSDKINKRKEEERKFGVFYDDAYDYMQHLRDSTDGKQRSSELVPIVKNTVEPSKDDNVPKGILKAVKGMVLPSSVFESSFEDPVGMLNKAAPRYGPRPDWDPDIVATLDDEFADFEDPENADAMEDDFIMNLVKEVGEESSIMEDGDCSSNFGSDDESIDFEECRDRLAGLSGSMGERTCRSTARSSHYSMSSSVIRRNEQLSLLDDRFDNFFASAYEDDDQMGALDCEHIEGCVAPETSTSSTMQRVMNDYKRESVVRFDLSEACCSPTEISDVVSRAEDISAVHPPLWERICLNDCRNKNGGGPTWDCASIISTRSNLYNHPTVIREELKSDKIMISGRTGIPKGVLGKGLTKQALGQLDREYVATSNPCVDMIAESLASRISVLSFRNPHETIDDKRTRKSAVREFRRERRVEKKINRLAFRGELDRQARENISFRQAAQGTIKIA